MLKKRIPAFLLAIAILAMPAAVLAQAGDDVKLVLGGEYRLAAGERLFGDLAVVGGVATLEEGSAVEGDVLVVGGSAAIAGDIRGNLVVAGGSVDLRDTAAVAGDVASFGGSVRRAPGAIVRGESFDRLPSPEIPDLEIPVPEIPDLLPATNSVRDKNPLGWFLRGILGAVGALGLSLLAALVAAVALVIAPRRFHETARAARTRPAVCFGAGLVTLAVGFLAGALLLIVCGLGVLIWLVLLCAWIIGWITMGLWFGRWLLDAMSRRDPAAIWAAALGAFLITLASRIPCVGWLFAFVVGAIGLGAVILTRLGTQRLGIPPGGHPGGLDLDGLEAQTLGDGAGADSALPPSAPAEVSGAQTAPSGSGGGTPNSAPIAEGAHQPPAITPDPTAAPGAVPPPAPQQVAVARALLDIRGIGPVVAERLAAAGIISLEQLAAATVEQLAAASGRSPQRISAEDWQGQAERLLL
jgi:predicted flap endonuclease-1-like 5' DNA nuclease